MLQKCKDISEIMLQQYISEYMHMHFKPRDDLPDPSGAFLSSVTFAAIALANREFQKLLIHTV